MYMTISEAWQTMLFLEKIYWCFAIPFSLLFVIQLVLTFFGGDMDAVGVDGDADFSIEHDSGISFQFISLKNLIAFFTIFGWAGITCIDAGLANWLSILISTLCGLIMMAIMAAIVYFMGKLTESGTLELNHAIGKVGSVYLTIPPKRNGMGKVQIKVQGLQTLDALTDSDEEIKTGGVVEVVEIINNEILLVKQSGK
ncbi:MAG: serine protease [Bacteroidales bacterium]|nr:serine protease [Bacteroidales bacterium]MBN2819977.1 serine protease [Bacteroidales bacterium]